MQMPAFTLLFYIVDSDNEEKYTHFNTLSELASSHYSLIAFQPLHNSRVFTQDGITHARV